MWLLLACVTEIEKPSGGDAPFSDDDTADTGDTGGGWEDSGNANDRCVAPPAEHALLVGGGTWDWAAAMVADLDGGGAPDLLHETWTPSHSVALVPGEDAAAGATTPSAWMPTRLGDSSVSVGVAGDVDGDGQADVAVGENTSRGRRALSVWSPASTTEPLWTVSFPDAENAAVLVARGERLDVDGNGLAEAALAAGNAVYVFDGLDAGEHTEADAALVVTTEPGSGYSPHAAGDLDGDGLDDLLFVARKGLAYEDHVLLPGDLAADGGVLDAADLDVLVTMEEYTRLPFFVDLDADGLEELFVQDWLYNDSFSVLGFAGTAVASAAATGATLDGADAFVTLEEEAYNYLGGHLAPVTDGDCLPGVAASAHFGERVYLFANADLRAGGTLAAEDTVALGGRPEWFGYVLAGGHDVDLDGSFDLVVGNMDGDLSLLLSPWDLAVAP